MKAMVYTKYGSPDNLSLQEVNKPIPKPNEVLIKVKAASINAWDHGLLIGDSFIVRLSGRALRKPKIQILGCDVTGVIETVGSDIKNLKVGDEVFGDLSGGKWGGFSEYTCAKEEELILKPPSMTFEEAAAFPQAGLLAYQGLRKFGELNASKILINGAGGGVGPIAIQIAKQSGAEVTGVDRKEKLDFMKDLGADYVIDFEEEDFTLARKKYDLILDNEVSHGVRAFKRSLTKSGMAIMLGGHNIPLVFRNALFGGKRIRILALEPNVDDLNALSSLYIENKAKPIIDSCYPLEQLPQAMHHYGSGLAKGKVVITI